MDRSAPCSNSLVIIAIQTNNKLLGINPMGRISPWADYIEIIALDPVNRN